MDNMCVTGECIFQIDRRDTHPLIDLFHTIWSPRVDCRWSCVGQTEQVYQPSGGSAIAGLGTKARVSSRFSSFV